MTVYTEHCRYISCVSCMMHSVDESLLNTWGGSVSIGHPFGATGVRLLSHAANRHAPDTAADNTM